MGFNASLSFLSKVYLKKVGGQNRTWNGQSAKIADSATRQVAGEFSRHVANLRFWTHTQSKLLSTAVGELAGEYPYRLAKNFARTRKQFWPPTVTAYPKFCNVSSNVAYINIYEKCGVEEIATL